MPRVRITRPDEAAGGTPMAVSLRSTRELTTGDWRTFRPQYVTRESPCNLDCPAGTDVRRFLAQAAAGDAAGAWRTILEHNPLPGICGRVCYHPCERACNRADLDEAIAVHSVERAVADEARRLGRAAVEKLSRAPATGRRAAIVGAGPAGLSCAYHLILRGHGVTIYDERAEPGGMLRYGIPAYRLPREVLDAEIELLRALGVRFVPRTPFGSAASLDALSRFDAAFLAVGLQRSKPARIDGDGVTGVRPAIELLREANADGLPALHGHVVVVGGGNTAIDAARIARRAGASVILLYRRSREDMPAHPDEIEQAESEGVDIVCQTLPVRVLSDEGRLSGVVCQRTRPGPVDASGRRSPEPIPGATFVVSCAHLLTAIGEELDADAFTPLVDIVDGRLASDAWGRARTGGTPAVFAGGDAATGAGTVVEAIGSGRRAAEAIDAWLGGRAMDEASGATRVGPADMNLFYIDRAARVLPRRLGAARALRGLDEVTASLGWTDAVREAARCVTCGACTHCNNCVVFCPDAAVREEPLLGGYSIDLRHCKGCGICVAECPRGAIQLVPEVQR